MIFIAYDPVGRTLEDVLSEGTYYSQGVSVFVLADDRDTVGKMMAEDFSLMAILKNHPELRDAKVVRHEDFFGESVFRVEMSNNEEEQKNGT